jgi:hypothetical protein
MVVEERPGCGCDHKHRRRWDHERAAGSDGIRQYDFAEQEKRYVELDAGRDESAAIVWLVRRVWFVV